MKKILSLIIVLALALSFTAFASETDFLFVESPEVEDGTTSAFIGDTIITLKFSDKVDGDVDLDVTITKPGEESTEADCDVEIPDYDPKSVEVYFYNGLEYGAKYVIDFSGIKRLGDEATVANDKKTLTFTVEPKPEVIISELESFVGVGTENVTTKAIGTDIESGVQCLSAKIQNFADEAKAVTAICAFYDNNGLLKKIVYSTKTVLAKISDEQPTTDELAIGTEVPAELKKMKLFFWDNMEVKSPYLDSYSFNITP